MSRKKTREKLDGELDKTLLRMVKDGSTVLSKDGKPVKIDASHQVLEVIRKRLSDLGLTKENSAESAAAELARRRNANNPKALEMTDLPEYIEPDSDEPNADTG